MARPADPNRRSDILSAAREEFIARGFAGARMDDIARRVGVSKAAIYLNFTSKEEIFHSLVHELIATSLPKMAPPDFGDAPAPQLLRGFIAAAFQIVASREVAFLPRLIIGEGQNFPELARFYHDEAISRLMGIIGSILRHGVARGEFACSDIDNASRSIAGGIIVTAIWRIVFEPVGADPVDVAAATQAHADTILNGLLARKEA